MYNNGKLIIRSKMYSKIPKTKDQNAVLKMDFRFQTVSGHETRINKMDKKSDTFLFALN